MLGPFADVVSSMKNLDGTIEKQSAGNTYKKGDSSIIMKKKTPLCGSSETTRETPFDFTLFYKYGHAHHISKIPETFLEWFIGFYEGDGSIYSSKTSYSKRRFSFQITQKDQQFIERLQYTFGFGNISKETRTTGVYWKWTLESKENVESIAYLLHGNLIWPYRQIQYIEWIQTGQKQGLFQQIPFGLVMFPDRVEKISFTNAWLSGFIDAEGCFYAHLREIGPKRPDSQLNIKFSQKMHLTQALKAPDRSDLIVFERFQKVFELKTKIQIFQNKSEGKFYARVECWTLMSQELLINYLKCYKLKTQKYISYRRWWRVWIRRKEQTHLTNKGRKRLYRLVNSINQKQ